MTHTEQLRRALRAYDIAGPETPERADALAAVLSAAHGVCDTTPEPEELQLAFYDATKNGLTYQYEGWGGRWRSKHIGADEYRADTQPHTEPRTWPITTNQAQTDMTSSTAPCCWRWSFSSCTPSTTPARSKRHTGDAP